MAYGNICIFCIMQNITENILIYCILCNFMTGLLPRLIYDFVILHAMYNVYITLLLCKYLKPYTNQSVVITAFRLVR